MLHEWSTCIDNVQKEIVIHEDVMEWIITVFLQKPTVNTKAYLYPVFRDKIFTAQ